MFRGRLPAFILKFEKVIERGLPLRSFYFETPRRISACCFICRPLVRLTDCPPNIEPDHERSSPGCVCAPPRPPRGLLLPGLLLPVPDPASRPGGPGGPLRRPPVWLGLHGHHLHTQAGGRTAVLQRVLRQRRDGELRVRGALHVPDPHGDLRAGPGGNVHVTFAVRVTVGVFKLRQNFL